MEAAIQSIGHGTDGMDPAAGTSAYLERHDLQRLLSEAVTEAVRARADDPVPFIGERLIALAHGGDVPTGLPKAQQQTDSAEAAPWAAEKVEYESKIAELNRLIEEPRIPNWS